MAEADQLISTAAEHAELPDNYVRPEAQQRPLLSEVVSDEQIPVIDLADPDRAGVVAKKVPLSTGFYVLKENAHNWRDYLRLHCDEVRKLGLKLYRAISGDSESLELEEGYKERVLGGQEAQHMAVKFYPRCPAPELTYGLPAKHTDPDAPAILLSYQQVAPAAGQPVSRGGGSWIAANPSPDALVINIGDQLRELSSVTPHVDQPALPVRGGGGGGHVIGVGGQLEPAAITLAVAGLTAGGAVNPSTAVPLLLTLIAGVALVIVRVARAS